MMNGSLLPFDVFFSDIKYLKRCLPVPRATQRSGFSTGYTALHALIASASRLPREVLMNLLGRFSTPTTRESTPQAIVLTPDMQGRSPVYLALHLGDVALATSLVTDISDSSKSRVPISTDGHKDNSGGRIASLYSRFAADNIARLDDQLRCTLQGSFVNGRSGSLLYLLSLNLDRVEMLWQNLIQKCNIGALAKMMYDPAGQIVDCFQKAKVAMLLLNIPFSQISEKNSQYYSRQHYGKNSPADSPVDKDKENHENCSYFSNCKDLTPDKLRKLISWKTAVEIKTSLKEWVAFHLRTHNDSMRHLSETGGVARNPSFCEVVLTEHKFAGAYGGVSEAHVHDAARVGLESSVLLFKATDISLVRFGSENRLTSDDQAVGRKDATIWGSSVPPLLLAETRRHRGRGVEGVHKMARLLSTFKNNADLINDALKCAMVVLEFAKSICNARILVSLSHQPYPTSDNGESISRNLPALGSKSNSALGATPARYGDEAVTEHHPIDLLRAQVKGAKKYSSRLYSQLSQYGEAIEDIDSEIHKQLLSVGARTYVVGDDEISESSLAKFMSIGCEVSPTYSKLRNIINGAVVVLVGIKEVHVSARRETGFSALKEILNRFMIQSTYDENEILTGSRDVSGGRGGEAGHSAELSEDEFCVLVKSIVAFFKNMRIQELAFIAMAISEDAGRGSHEEEEEGVAALVGELCGYVRQHGDVFNQKPTVAIQKSALSMTSPGDTAVPLSNCPCSYERKDLLKLVAFTSKNKTKNSDSHTLDLVDVHLRQLSEGYGVARKLIEIILRVIGVLASAHVYKADYLNWKGTSDCNPYLALCSVTNTSSNGITDLPRYVTDRGLENDLVICMDKFHGNNAVGRMRDISSPIPAILAQSSVFSMYTSLDFFVAVCALRGRPRLLKRGLEAMASSKSEEGSEQPSTLTDSMHLVWHVAWSSPPPPMAPVFVQYTSSLVDEEGFARDAHNIDEVNAEQYYHSCYEDCILLLLSSGYLADAPTGAALSVLDVAALKGMSRVVDALLTMDSVDHHFRPLSNISSVHFILLNDRIGSSALERVLDAYDYTSSVGDIVEFSSFLKDVNADVSLMHSTMTAVVTTVQAQLPLSVDISNEDMLGIQDGVVAWMPHKIVCTVFNALRGMVARRPKVQCPLFTLFTNYANEVGKLSEFDSSYEFRDYHQNDLVWTTLHVAMTCRSHFKFHSLWKRINGDGISDVSVSFSDSDGIYAVPLDLLHYACYYDMVDTLESLRQCESYSDLNSSIFFPPLNSSFTPLNVALRVGAHRCVSGLIKQQMSTSEGVGLNSGVLMSCVTAGYGGEQMAMILLDALVATHAPAKEGGNRSKQLLASLGTSVDTQSRFELEGGETLLHACARRNYAEMCDKLLMLGVDNSPLDGNGMSPIQVSIALGHSATTRVFGHFCHEESKAVRIIAYGFRLAVFRKMRSGHK
jgi:hypothetical protein